MNIKNLIIALASGAIALTSASAYNTNGYNRNEVIYVTGSTAFRGAANTALYNLYGANLYAQDNSKVASAGNVYYTNVTVNGSTFDISVAWSGSEAGIQTVASKTLNTTNLYLPFPDYWAIGTNGQTAANLTNGTKMVGGSMSALTNSSYTTSQRGLVAFSDTHQNASAFKTADLNGNLYDTLTVTNVGVVPFLFAASTGWPFSSNVTTEQLCSIFKNGFAYGNQWTGNATDTNTKVWGFGRNIDSGTGVTAKLIAHYGTVSPCVIYKPTVATTVVWTNSSNAALNVTLVNTNKFVFTNTTGVDITIGSTTFTNNTTNTVTPGINTLGYTVPQSSVSSITALAKYASNTINGIPDTSAGEASGGTLVKYLTNPIALTGNPFGVYKGNTSNCAIAYAGLADLLGSTYGTNNGCALGGGNTSNNSVPLTFNGVAGRFGNPADFTNNYAFTNLDAGYTNIINGLYPFWSYERVCYNQNTASTACTNFYTNIVSTILSTPTTNAAMYGNINLSDMRVQRDATGDASPIYSTNLTTAK